MTLTQQQIEQNAAAYIAAMNGKPWQYLSKLAGVDSWFEGNSGDRCTVFLSNGYLCRPKPEPEPPKPWDCQSDIPGPVCWVSENLSDDGVDGKSMIVGLDDLGIVCLNIDNVCEHFTWEDIAKQKTTFSTDLKTWKPCHKAAQ